MYEGGGDRAKGRDGYVMKSSVCTQGENDAPSFQMRQRKVNKIASCESNPETLKNLTTSTSECRGGCFSDPEGQFQEADRGTSFDLQIE